MTYDQVHKELWNSIVIYLQQKLDAIEPRKKVQVPDTPSALKEKVFSIGLTPFPRITIANFICCAGCNFVQDLREERIKQEFEILPREKGFRGCRTCFLQWPGGTRRHPSNSCMVFNGPYEKLEHLIVQGELTAFQCERAISYAETIRDLPLQPWYTPTEIVLK